MTDERDADGPAAARRASPDPPRPPVAEPQPRRAAPAVERAPGRHEPRRTPAAPGHLRPPLHAGRAPAPQVRPGLTGWAQVQRPQRPRTGTSGSPSTSGTSSTGRCGSTSGSSPARSSPWSGARASAPQGQATMPELRPPATAGAAGGRWSPPQPADSPARSSPAASGCRHPTCGRPSGSCCWPRSNPAGWPPSDPTSTPSRPSWPSAAACPTPSPCRRAPPPSTSPSSQVGVSPGDDVLVPDRHLRGHRQRRHLLRRPPLLHRRRPGHLADVAGAAGRRAGRAPPDGRRLPAAVVTVDLYGACADYDAILALCAEYGVPVVEDAAEALGATFGGRPAGSFGAAGVLSFNGNKIITTSSGGALLCHDRDVGRPGPLPGHPGPPARGPLRARRGRASTTGCPTSWPPSAGASWPPSTSGSPAAGPSRPATGRPSPISPASPSRPSDAGGTTNAWLTCITLEPGVAALSPEELRVELEAQQHRDPAAVEADARPAGLPRPTPPASTAPPTASSPPASASRRAAACPTPTWTGSSMRCERHSPAPVTPRPVEGTSRRSFLSQPAASE